MNRKTFFVVLALIAITVVMIFDSVRTIAAPKLVRFEGKTMGTAWHVTVVSNLPNKKSVETEAQYTEVQTALEEALKGVDFRMSTWKEYTELSRINAQEAIDEDISLSPEIALVLGRALEISQKTDGAYDVTVGPLVNLWKFGPTKENVEMPEIPSDEAIAHVRASVGWEALKILKNESENESEPVLRRQKSGLNIDLSSIAKGYGVDCAFEALKNIGFEDFMVEVGGEVRTSGVNHLGKPWRIGIEVPKPGVEGVVFGAVNLVDCALATSGDYRNFKVDGGRRRSHIIDPRTGKPVEHALVSVSVLASDCMTADAWATALMVLGPLEGQKVAVAEGLKVLFLVQHDDEIEPVCVDFVYEANPYIQKEIKK